jgi:hypothetical protein
MRDQSYLRVFISMLILNICISFPASGMTLFYFKLSQAHAALGNELIKNYSLMQENFLEQIILFFQDEGYNAK